MSVRLTLVSVAGGHEMFASLFKKNPTKTVEALLNDALDAAGHRNMVKANVACDSAWKIAAEQRSASLVRATAKTWLNVSVAGKNWRQAEQVMKRACALLTEISGPAHIDTYDLERTLAEVLWQRGKWDESCKLLESIAKRIAPNTIERAGIDAERAGVLSKAGRHDEAIVTIEAVHSFIRDTFQEGHRHRIWIDECAGVISSRAGRHEEAITFLERANQSIDATPDRGLAAAVALSLAAAWAADHRYAQAQRLLNYVLQEFQDVVDHPTLVEHFADVALGHGEPEKATHLYFQAADLTIAQFGDDHFNLITILEGLARALEASGDSRAAAEVTAKRDKILRLVRA